MQNRSLSSERHSQMIVLMGIVLAVSVFIISSIPSEISDLGATVPKARSQSLLPEFIHLKETFGHALNYNLVSIELSDSPPDLAYYGHIYGIDPAIEESVTKIADILKMMELQHDRIFKVTFNSQQDIHFSHLSSEGHVYHVDVGLYLDDGYTSVEQSVTYSIVCKEAMPP